MNKIAFFSSDYRKLYQEDIFRTLALPKGYVLKFRYQAKYVSELFQDRTCRNKEGVIFYTIGNSSPINQKENISIRDVKIRDIKNDDQTGIIYFYLELGDFKEYRIINGDPNFPSDKFVLNVDVELGNAHKWHQRIQSVRHGFDKKLFFNLSLRQKTSECASENVIPYYDSQERQSIYLLEDESEYIIDLLLYDDLENDRSTINKQTHNTLKISAPGKVLSINTPEAIKVGAIIDNHSIGLITHSLDIIQSGTFLKFVSDIDISEADKTIQSDSYEVLIKTTVRKSQMRTMKFAILSTLVVLSTAVISLSVGHLVRTNFYFPFIFSVISLLVLILSSKSLYWVFNKK